MTMLPGYDGRFGLRCWPDGYRSGPPKEVVSDDLGDLRARARDLISNGVCDVIDLSAWSFELNDWVALESFERTALA